MESLWPAEVNRAMRGGTGKGFPVSRKTRVGAVVAIAAVVAPFAGAAPTGSEVFDWLWAAGLAALLAYLGSTAKRGPLLIAALVALLTARSAPGIAFGVIAVVAAGSSTRNLRRRNLFARGASGAASLISLFAADGRVGAWQLAVAWVLVLGLVIGSGWARSSRIVRHRLVVGGAAGAGVALAACAFAAISVADNAGLVDAGTTELRLGLAFARLGDADQAAEHLERTQEALSTAEHRIGRWGAGALAVPVASQHVDAVTSVLDNVAEAANRARQAAAVAQDDQLTIRTGRLDLEVVDALANPLRRLANTLDDVVADVDRHQGSPLLPPLRRRLDELDAEARRASREATLGALAAETMPDLLGANGERRYLVLFTSPAEARGRFGFPGSFAEVIFDDGRFLLGEHGSLTQAFTTLQVDQASFDEGDPEIRPYSIYGVTRELQAVTIPPDFPTVAANAAEMWAQSGRVPVNGVLRFDPSSLAPLLSFTGPVEIKDLDEPLTAENVEQFLLVDQYVQFPDGQAPRREVLETVSDVTFERLEVVDLPAPRRLFDLFSPLVASGHLGITSFDPAGSALLERVGTDGEFAPPVHDGVMVTTVNGLGNKIDSLLSTDLTYAGRVDDGVLDATLDVRLQNDAPSSGLPDYVIGSFLRPAPPRGTNRSTVFVYTAAPADQITLDGQPVQAVSGRTGPWWLHQIVVDIPPGGARTVRLHLQGELPEGPYRLGLIPGGGTQATTVRVDLDVDGRAATYGGRPERETIVR